MKRSKVVRLVLLGSAGAAGLTACDEPVDPFAGTQFFKRVEDCQAWHGLTACQTAATQAQARHRSSAPAFHNREACEQRFGRGNCTPIESWPSAGQIERGAPSAELTRDLTWHVPGVHGFLYGPGPVGHPVYRDHQNFSYSGEHRLGCIDAAYDAPPPAATTPAPAPCSVERGGFGSSGRWHSAAS